MVDGSTTTYAISEFESRLGEVHLIQLYVIKSVSKLRQVGGFFPGIPVSSTNKTDCHNLTEILMKQGVKHHSLLPKLQI